MNKRKWEDLTLSNDFLFSKVMGNLSICKELIEKLLDIGEIERIEYPEKQKAIDIDRDAKSVRLDVYVKDDQGTVYNVEMQATDTGELPQRSRYYQSMIDLDMLEKGVHYKTLKRSYVIFICTEDIFDKEMYRYSFENICKEIEGFRLEDGTHKIFFNTKGIHGEISDEIRDFLRYVDGNESDNAFVKRLAEEVLKVKNNDEWRREYMTLIMRDQENLEKGIEKGRAKERREIAENLIDKMEDDQEIATITRLSVEEIRKLRRHHCGK